MKDVNKGQDMIDEVMLTDPKHGGLVHRVAHVEDVEEVDCVRRVVPL